MLENKLFAFTLFLTGINDWYSIKSVFDHFVGTNCGQKERYNCIYIYIGVYVYIYIGE